MAKGAGRIIAFEGVDGAGKSTVIKYVARELRSRGVRVLLPRTGKEHDSRPARMIRRLTRDARNYAMSPRAELSLFCAREAQVLDETVRPALAEGATVLLDRSLLTPVVMGAYGRGLSREGCERVAAEAAGGLQPDLTLLFDVHPRTSRLRKQIEKVRGHSRERGGRKGLSGTGFKERMRDGYLEVGAERGYPIFRVERVTPAELCERVMRVVDGGPLQQSPADGEPLWRGPADWTLDAALQALAPEAALFMANGLRVARGLRARLQATEPALCAWSMDEEDPLASALFDAEPAYTLRRLSGRPLQDDDLRRRALDVDPDAGLAALRYVQCAESDALRTRYAGAAPDGVVRSLAGRTDAFAEALRARCWSDASDEARASGLSHCDSEAAWALREKLLEKDVLYGLDSLRGVPLVRVPGLLASLAPHAPKRVLRALAGRDDEASFDLREQLLETGREAIESLGGLDHPRAWAMRRAAVARAPSTVLHSMERLADTAQRRALIEDCRAQGAGDVHMLRRMQSLQEQPLRPRWASAKALLLEEDT